MGPEEGEEEKGSISVFMKFSGLQADQDPKTILSNN